MHYQLAAPDPTTEPDACASEFGITLPLPGTLNPRGPMALSLDPALRPAQSLRLPSVPALPQLPVVTVSTYKYAFACFFPSLAGLFAGLAAAQGRPRLALFCFAVAFFGAWWCMVDAAKEGRSESDRRFREAFAQCRRQRTGAEGGRS